MRGLGGLSFGTRGFRVCGFPNCARRTEAACRQLIILYPCSNILSFTIRGVQDCEMGCGAGIGKQHVVLMELLVSLMFVSIAENYRVQRDADQWQSFEDSQGR